MKKNILLILCLFIMIILLPLGVKAADYGTNPFSDPKLVIDCFEKDLDGDYTTTLNKNISLTCILTIENVDSSSGITSVYGEVSSQDFGNILKVGYVDTLNEIDVDSSDPKNLKISTNVGSFAFNDEERWLFLGNLNLEYSDEFKNTALVEDASSVINFLNFKINDTSIENEVLTITLAKNESSSSNNSGTSSGSSSSSSSPSVAKDKLQASNNVNKTNKKITNPNTSDINVLLLSLSCILLIALGTISFKKLIKM